MEFIKGMDISFLPEMVERGAKFLDKEGREQDVFHLLKENGVNSIRLRIWNEPENVPESGGYCNLEQTIAMAKKVKDSGMSLFLDFHYSDWWADPGKQEKPKAWKELSFEELKQAVYEYTKGVLLKMEKEEVFPDIIQIGNEIRSGMLFPEGEVPHFERLVPLINAGIRAVREMANNRDTKIVIHLDQGGRFFYLRDWFDAAISEGLEDFDVIGVSYYPFWHGTFEEFKNSLVSLVERYEKPIVVAETAHAWRCMEDGFVGKQQEKIAGFPATPEDQRKVIDLVMNITASLKSDKGLGIYYWEPLVFPWKGIGGWSSNMGIFDEQGRALPTLESFQFDRKHTKFTDIAKIYEPEKLCKEIGTDWNLPEYLKVLYYDGTCPNLSVEWEVFEKDKLGKQTVIGRIPSINREVKIELEIVEVLEKSFNYIPNGNFENGLDGWKISCEEKRVKTELHPDFDDPFPAPPVYHLFLESPVNFSAIIESEVADLVPGTYCLQVEYRGTNTTGVDVRLFAQAGENEKQAIIFPTDEDWINYQIPDILIEDKIKLGLKIVSPPVFGKIRKFTLTRQEKDK